MEVDPLVDIIENDLQAQLTTAFEGVDRALRAMQSDLSRYVVERLRMDSLTKVNYSAIPKYDASHPHWKTDLVDTVLEGTNYFVPVDRQSTLQYPFSVNRYSFTSSFLYVCVCASIRQYGITSEGNVTDPLCMECP